MAEATGYDLAVELIAGANQGCNFALFVSEFLLNKKLIYLPKTHIRKNTIRKNTETLLQ